MGGSEGFLFDLVGGNGDDGASEWRRGRCVLYKGTYRGIALKTESERLRCRLWRCFLRLFAAREHEERKEEFFF